MSNADPTPTEFMTSGMSDEEARKYLEERDAQHQRRINAIYDAAVRLEKHRSAAFASLSAAHTAIENGELEKGAAFQTNADAHIRCMSVLTQL
jgi:predicted negative regulator of RcsB-dependent stress response